MKITLKVEKDNAVESVQYEISKLKMGQVTKSLVVIKDIFEVAKDDESLRTAFTDMFVEQEVEQIESDEETEQQEEQETEQTNADFFFKIAGAYETLLFTLPDKAIELLSVLSGVDKSVVMSQEVEDVFDIYDAVLEVNDIEKLIGRAKKSLAVTQKAMNYRNLVSQATAQTTQQ